MPFGLSAIGIGRSLLGGIFGKRSTYTFKPGHPPGAFRGKAALDDYNRRMRELGLSNYTSSATRPRPNIAGSGPSIVSSALAMITPGVLQKLSPIMPGGAVITNMRYRGDSSTGKPRKKRRRASSSARRPKRRTRRRKLSRAQLAAGFGGRRRRRRR